MYTPSSYLDGSAGERGAMPVEHNRNRRAQISSEARRPFLSVCQGCLPAALDASLGGCPIYFY